MQANAERAAHQTKTHYEMSKLEAEIMGLKAELQVSEDRRRVAEAEAYDFKKQAREHGDPKKLSLNFEMLKSQKHEIEKKLDAEVKIKLDLFSALGNAKRQLRDQDGKKMLVHHILENSLRWYLTRNQAQAKFIFKVDEVCGKISFALF